MTKALRVLVCEDNEDDYELLVLELRRAGYQSETIRVESAAELRAARGHINRWENTASVKLLDEQLATLGFAFS